MGSQREQAKVRTNASPASGHLDVSGKFSRKVKAITEIPKDVHKNKY